MVGAGFVGCKMVAKWPARVASLTMLSTTQCGWHMAAQMMKRPWVTLKVHTGPVHELHIEKSLYTCEPCMSGAASRGNDMAALACGPIWQVK